MPTSEAQSRKLYGRWDIRLSFMHSQKVRHEHIRSLTLYSEWSQRNQSTVGVESTMYYKSLHATDNAFSVRSWPWVCLKYCGILLLCWQVQICMISFKSLHSNTCCWGFYGTKKSSNKKECQIVMTYSAFYRTRSTTVGKEYSRTNVVLLYMSLTLSVEEAYATKRHRRTYK